MSVAQNHGAERPGWKRRTALFLGGQTISLFGSSLAQYAIIWHITLTTQSGSVMTLATLFGFLPQMVVSLFGGTLADRFNRKRLIILADGVIALATLALAVLFLTGRGRLWHIFLVSAIRSAGAGVQSPAVGALLPQLVPQKKLMRVGGINSSLQSLILLISPAAGGALLTLFSLEYAFFVDVVTAAVAITLMLFLKVPDPPRTAEHTARGYFEDLKDGLSYTTGHPLVRGMLLYYTFFMFLIVPAAFLTPLYVTRRFGDEVWRLTANEMAFSLGSVVGGLAVAAWGGFKNRIHTIMLSCIAFGVLSVALGLAGTFWLYLVIMAVTGLFIPAFNTAGTVLLQEKVEPEMHGRVFGFVQIVASCIMPLGMLVFGPLADALPIQWLFISTGAVTALLGAVIHFSGFAKRFG